MILFITGNDTDIGKTFATSIILSSFLNSSSEKKYKKIAVVKPVESGVNKKNKSDLDFIKEFNKKNIEITKNVDFFNYYSFSNPISPYTASLIENKRISISLIRRNIKELSRDYPLILVEGAGGLEVPLTKKYKVINLIKDLNASCYLVVNPNLGTINHTLLSINALKCKKISFKGVIFNNYPTNPKISELYNPIYLADSGVKIAGVIPKFRKRKDSNFHAKTKDYLDKNLDGNFDQKEFVNNSKIQFAKSFNA